MKKLTITAFLILLSLNALAAEKNIEVDRFSVWVRSAFQAKFTKSGFGAMAMFGSRNSLYSKKEVNGTEADYEIRSWLQEFWVGPAWGKKFGKLKYSVNLFYHPMFWFADNEGGKFYTRHSLSSHHNLWYNFGPLKAHYRTIFWDHLPGKNGDDKDLDNEFYNRHLLGIIIPVGSKFDFILEDEVMLKYTASKSDADGVTEVFAKNLAYAGFNIKPAESINMALRYINTFSNKANSEALKVSVIDHYFFIQLTVFSDFSK